MTRKRIFLDVGAHLAETAREVVSDEYAFDKIYCFEPASSCWSAFEGLGERVELCKFGLWNETCEKELYSPGSLAASIFEDTLKHETEVVETQPETIELVKASEWFRENITPNDLVLMKINCEGSECDLLDNLIDSGQLRNVYNVMVDFDVRFIPSLRKREKLTRDRLRKEGYENVSFTEDVMKGETHETRIRNWLNLVGIEDKLPVEEMRVKHAAVLRDLSARTGRSERIALTLRRYSYDLLPEGARNILRNGFRRLKSS